MAQIELTTIETNFLSNAAVKTGLKLREIKNLQNQLSNGQKKKFAQSIELSETVFQSYSWYQSAEGKQAATLSGITWNSEEFAMRVFGWQKSYFYKLIKVAKLPTGTVQLFTDECDRIESEGGDSIRSIEALLKWAKATDNGTRQTDNEGEGEGEGEGENEGSPARESVVSTFTYKGLNGHTNVSVRLTDGGKLKTVNAKSEILQALALLMEAVQNDSSLA